MVENKISNRPAKEPKLSTRDSLTIQRTAAVISPLRTFVFRKLQGQAQIFIMLSNTWLTTTAGLAKNIDRSQKIHKKINKKPRVLGGQSMGRAKR